MFIDKFLKLMLSFIQCRLQYFVLFVLLLNLVLQLALLVKESITLLDKVDFVFHVGGVWAESGLLPWVDNCSRTLSIVTVDMFKFDYPPLSLLEPVYNLLLLKTLCIKGVLRHAELILRVHELLLYSVEIEHHIVDWVYLLQCSLA